MQDYRNELFEAQRWVGQLIANVNEQDLDLPTPCEDFNVRQLLVHLFVAANVITQYPTLGENPYASVFTDPETIAANEPLMLRTLEREHLHRRTESWQEYAHLQRQVWTDEAITRDYPMPWGVVLSGTETVGLYVCELVCHGYDLAKATNQPVEAPPAAAAAALEAAQKLISNDERGQAHGVPFEKATAAPEGAGTTVQLAAFLGRDVH